MTVERRLFEDCEEWLSKLYFSLGLKEKCILCKKGEGREDKTCSPCPQSVEPIGDLSRR